MLHDLPLPAAVDHDRHAMVLHGLDSRHAEVLDPVRIHGVEPARVPEDAGACVQAQELVVGEVDVDLDPPRLLGR